MINTHKVDPKKIELVELGADTDLYYPKTKKASKLRKKLGVKKDEIVLMFVGTIYRRKNIELFLSRFFWKNQ